MRVITWLRLILLLVALNPLFLAVNLIAQISSGLEKMKIGIGQLHVEGGNPERNLKNAISFIADAAQQKCDIIVLPECLDFGWTNSMALSGAQPIPGDFSQLLADAARAHHIYVIAGLTERAGDKIYNTAS